MRPGNSPRNRNPPRSGSWISTIHINPGIEDLYETLTFSKKPVHQNTVKQIQEHFAYLGLQAIKKQRGELKNNPPLEYSCELTLFGENGYTTTDLLEFIQGIIHDLPEADGFTITSKYYGPAVNPWSDHDVRESFYDFTIFGLIGYEEFTYKLYRYQYNCGAGSCELYEDGIPVKLYDKFSTDILDKEFGSDWWSDQVQIELDFDFDKHTGILEALHDAVRKYVPKEEQEECINCWEDGYKNLLIASVVWTPRKLRVIQDFLDAVNQIIAPILSECKGNLMGQWYMKEVPFAIAVCEWTEKGFRIIGTEL